MTGGKIALLIIGAIGITSVIILIIILIKKALFKKYEKEHRENQNEKYYNDQNKYNKELFQEINENLFQKNKYDDEFDYELHRKQLFNNDNIINTNYRQKDYFLSPIEKIVFKNIQIAIENTKLIVFPQINLATIVQRADNFKYQNELFRNLDFCLFVKDTYKPVCAIELNDRTHLQTDRQERDIKVISILQSAGIPLMTLYTANDNTPEYIRNLLKMRLKK